MKKRSQNVKSKKSRSLLRNEERLIKLTLNDPLEIYLPLQPGGRLKKQARPKSRPHFRRMYRRSYHAKPKKVFDFKALYKALDEKRREKMAGKEQDTFTDCSFSPDYLLPQVTEDDLKAIFKTKENL